MKGMNAAEIRSRLAEINNEQAAFDSRDFDAELSQVIVNGGNVDALEEQHLQAERLARRLRVERQALEGALPDTMAKEAAQAVIDLVEQHDQLRVKHHKKADEIVAAITQLEPLVEELFQLSAQMRNTAFSIDGKVGDLERKTGQNVDIPALQYPQHAPLIEKKEFLGKLSSRLTYSNVSRYDRGMPSKLTYKPADAA
ncbi:hypothetical protein ACT3R7_12570 [Halomonas sp. AOP43-A1-21]|uniref:hypothetical protein n=1 Tax=Halomonas TaxID=2745 RepID=UPI001865D5D4|nr:hypothetical protein [Halomonas colorata]